MKRLWDTDSSSSSETDEDIIISTRKVSKKGEDCLNKYNEKDFFEKFRITKVTAGALLNKIRHEITFPIDRGGCLGPKNQLLLTLRFYATGNIFQSIADCMDVSNTLAIRIIERVTNAIAGLLKQYIKMPSNNRTMETTAGEFYQLASFPRVIGAIDCTLIKIQSPGGDDAEIFRSQKGFLAINVQTVSDANLIFNNIVARWPGSSHDQTIFNNSNLKRQFHSGEFGQYMLIGDSDYSVQPYLMTPLKSTQNRAENLYNESLLRTRNVVEMQHRVWKKRFPILNEIKAQLPTVLSIIVATAVLHNIAIEMNEEIPKEWFNEDVREINDVSKGEDVRRLIVNEHFAKL